MAITYTRDLSATDFEYILTSKWRYVVLIYDLSLGIEPGFEPMYKRYFNNKTSADQFCFLQTLAYGAAYVIDFADPALSDDMWMIIKTEAIPL